MQLGINAQIGTVKLFGELAVEKWFSKDEDVEKLLEKQKIRRPLRGKILVEINKITREYLEVLLKKFKKVSKNRKDKSKSRT
jgi:hypothetical protein